MKQLSEIIHLYLGCEVHDTEKPKGTTAILDSIDTNGDCYYNYYNNETYESVEDTVMCSANDLELVLRSLEDIEPEHQEHITQLMLTKDVLRFMPQDGDRFTSINKSGTQAFTYLLSKHYDLHDLIPNGFAIDAKTLK